MHLVDQMQGKFGFIGGQGAEGVDQLHGLGKSRQGQHVTDRDGWLSFSLRRSFSNYGGMYIDCRFTAFDCSIPIGDLPLELPPGRLLHHLGFIGYTRPLDGPGALHGEWDWLVVHHPALRLNCSAYLVASWIISPSPSQVLHIPK